MFTSIGSQFPISWISRQVRRRHLIYQAEPNLWMIAPYQLTMIKNQQEDNPFIDRYRARGVQ